MEIPFIFVSELKSFCLKFKLTPNIIFMIFNIKEANGEFLAEGVISKHTVDEFVTLCQNIITKTGELTINIDGVTQIDRIGIEAIKALYDQAIIKITKFAIVGNGCKEIYDDIKATTIAA
jgi:anti-anti-sigma regulatory factor